MSRCGIIAVNQSEKADIEHSTNVKILLNREDTDTIVSAYHKVLHSEPPTHRIALIMNRNKSMANKVQNEETEYGMSPCLNHYSSTQKGIDDK